MGITIKNNLCKCGNKHYAKGMCIKCYGYEYRKQSKVKERIKKYHQKLEVKLQKKSYRIRPENKNRKKKLKQTPKYRSYIKKYNQRPEVKERVRKWNQLPENKIKRKEKYKKPEVKKRIKNYYQRQDIKKRENNRRLSKYYNDILQNLKVKMRGRLRTFLKLKNIPKNKSTMDMVGCTPQELRDHIEKQFTIGMSWKYVLSGDIHIDHIIPLSLVKTEEELYRLFHYTNLQPLWERDNIIKSDKIPLGWDGNGN